MLAVTMWLTVYTTVFYFVTIVGSKTSQSKFENFDFYISKFKEHLNSHIDDILSYHEISDMLEKYENDLAKVKINATESFISIYRTLGIKYNDLPLAVQNLARAFEKDHPYTPLNLLIRKREVIEDPRPSVMPLISTSMESSNTQPSGLNAVPYLSGGGPPPILPFTASTRSTEKSPMFGNHGIPPVPGSPSEKSSFPPPPFSPDQNLGISSLSGPPTIASKLQNCCESGYISETEYDGRFNEKVKDMACGDVVNVNEYGIQKMKVSRFASFNISKSHIKFVNEYRHFSLFC